MKKYGEHVSLLKVPKNRDFHARVHFSNFKHFVPATKSEQMIRFVNILLYGAFALSVCGIELICS